jgi:hypothetical protein
MSLSPAAKLLISIAAGVLFYRQVDCNSLAPGSRIEVETKSRHYQIECMGGNAIRISGHPEYCPNPMPARLHGSLDQEGGLEFGLIGRGMRFNFC